MGGTSQRGKRRITSRNYVGSYYYVRAERSCKVDRAIIGHWLKVNFNKYTTHFLGQAGGGPSDLIRFHPASA